MAILTRRGIPALSLMLLCVVLSAACGGRSHDQPSPTPESETPDAALPTTVTKADGTSLNLNLPSPRQLDRRTSAGPSDGQLVTEGSNYYTTMPHQNVSSSFPPFLDYSGSWVPGSDSSGLAYAGYQFHQLTGYDREEGIRLVFQAPPADPGTVYLGMGNFASDAWDWYGYQAGGYTPMSGFANYISGAGNLFVIVMLAGQDNLKLEQVLVGERLHVEARLNDDLDDNPALNVAPLTVNWDASTSYVLGGEIVSFDFDFEDDGSWDVSGDEDGLESHNYTEPGSHTCRLRAHDDAGQTGEATVEFWAVDPSNNPPVADLQASATSGNAPLTIDFDASGSTDDTGIQLYEWDFDNDGKFELSGTESQRSYTFARGGFTQITLRVTDDDFAVDTAMVGILVTGGFSLIEVADLNVGGRMDIDLCGIGGAELYPTVALHDLDNQALKVIKAKDESGIEWGPVINAVPTEDDTGYSPVLARGSGDRPVVVFGRKFGNDWRLESTWPGFAAADRYDAWNGPWPIDELNNTGGQNSIFSYGGTMHVASVSDFPVSGSQSVYYYRSIGTSGNNWETGVKVFDGPSDGGIAEVAMGRSVFNIFSYPLIGYSQYVLNGEEPFGFGAVNTTDLSGATWGEPTLIDGARTGFVSTLLADGYPLLVAGGISATDELYAARATSATGSSWPESPQELAGHGGSCDVSIVDGKPAICFQNELSNLQYVSATNAQGTDWNEPFNVDTGVNVGADCAMTVIGGTNPIIVYFDDYNNIVKEATWLTP